MTLDPATDELVGADEGGELVVQNFVAGPFTSVLFAVSALIPLGAVSVTFAAGVNSAMQLAVDPAMRGWVSAVANYAEPVGIGEVMLSLAVGEVLAQHSEATLPAADVAPALRQDAVAR